MQLEQELTKNYIKGLDDAKDTMSYWVTEHLRMSGVYWGLSGMALLNALDEMPRQVAIDFVLSCQHSSGGFSGNLGHDPHLLYTLSAVQILCLYDALDHLDIDKVASYILFIFKFRTLLSFD
jgi:geranylgeranyl transferase type-2 subunit beta